MPSDDKNTPVAPAKGQDQKGQDQKGDEPKTEPQKKAGDDGDAGGGGGDKNIASQLAVFKKRASDAEAKLDKLEKEKLEKDGDLKGLLEKSEKRLAKLNGELKDVKVKALKSKLAAEFSKHAPDAQNVELLSKLDEVKKTVNMDQDTLEISGVKDAVASARKSHPYLFKQQTKGWGSGIPIDPKKGDASDADAFVAAMRKARTPREKWQTRKEFNREL